MAILTLFPSLERFFYDGNGLSAGQLPNGELWGIQRRRVAALWRAVVRATTTFPRNNNCHNERESSTDDGPEGANCPSF